MSMYPPSEQASYSPSPEQLERERALKRFNRLYIYVPVTVAVIIVVVLVVLMLIGILAPGLVGANVFLSGLADTILVLWMIPMMVLFALVPIGYVAYLVNRRQRRDQLPPDSPLLRHSRAQMAMWQAQNIVDRVGATSEGLSDRIAKPLLRLDSSAAYLFAWLDILAKPFRRNDNYDPDGADSSDEPDRAA